VGNIAGPAAIDTTAGGLRWSATYFNVPHAHSYLFDVWQIIATPNPGEVIWKMQVTDGAIGGSSVSWVYRSVGPLFRFWTTASIYQPIDQQFSNDGLLAIAGWKIGFLEYGHPPFTPP